MADKQGELFEVTNLDGDLKGRQFFFKGELATVELKPGDVFVFHSEATLSSDMIARMKAMLEGWFPGHKAIFIDKDMTLGVMRSTKEEN